MIRRYYDPATGIDLLPDVPTDLVDDGRGSVLRGVLCAGAMSGSFLLLIWLALAVTP